MKWFFISIDLAGLMMIFLNQRYDTKEVIMAMPIAPTPILKGQDAVDFYRKVEEDLKRPVTLSATPKIEKARELIRQYASKHKK